MKAALGAAVLAALVIRPPQLYGAGTSISIDASTVLTQVQPGRFYGNNTAYWVDTNLPGILKSKVEQTGAKFIRYPGGSGSNVYHWNGTGSYSNGVWTSSNSAFTPGFGVEMSYRGTTSPGYGKASMLSDGNFATEWRSETTTANGGNIYFYINLGSVKNFDSVRVTWGSVYATRYDILVSNASMTAPPYNNAVNNWVLVKSVSGGTGGTDNQAFSTQSARWIRIDCIQSSSGLPHRDFRAAEFEVFNGSIRQSVHDSNPSIQSPTAASPTSNQNSFLTTGPWFFDFEEYMAWINSMTPPRPEPVITVNFGTGTPEEAAAWVYYANVVKGYAIKHWEVGNEMEGDWEHGGPVNAVYYANRFVKFSEAMKAVDPTIKVHGAQLGALLEKNQLYDTSAPTFMELMLKQLQTLGKLGTLDVLNYHIYANWPNTNDAATLASPNDWTSGPNYKAFIDSLNSTYYPGAPRENMMGEYNSGPSTNFTVKLQNGLWLANWLAEYMKAFGTSGYATLWDISNALGQETFSGTWGDHAFLEHGSPSIAAAYRYQERAHYWAMHMMRNRFTLDGAGNSLVACTSSQALLPAYACRRNDSRLTLLVINKSPSTAYSASISISNFAPGAAGTLYTFAGAVTAPYYAQNYVWNDNNSANSYADPDLPPVANAYPVPGGTFSHSFPPYSISVFEFTNSNQTFTVTPTRTPSPTASPTFTPVAAIVWNDMEAAQTVQPWAASADGMNGATVTAYAISSVGTAVHAGSYGFASSHNTGAPGSWGSSLTLGSPYGTGPSLGYRDLSGTTWVEVWVKSSLIGLKIRLAIKEAGTLASPINGADGENFLSNGGAFSTITLADTWTLLQFPLSGFIDDPFYPYSPASQGNNSLNLGAISGVTLQLQGNQGSGISLIFDDIRFLTDLGAPTLTPTRSPSPTRTASPSPTGSGTATPSATLTRTPSATRSPTPTLSSTLTSSRTASASPSVSGTPSATSSASPSPAGSVTFTPSSSPSASPSPSFTLTPTVTPSPTASLTSTRSPSPSASPTPTTTASVSATRSPSPSATPTPSTSPSFTATPIVSPSPTASRTATQSPSSSATPSPSPSPTNSASPSSSPTPSASMSVTLSPIASVNPTLTPTLAPTSGLTLSPTLTAQVPASSGPPPFNGQRPEVRRLVPVPNPQAGPSLRLAFELSAPADRVELRIYSRAMVLVQVETLVILPAHGWQSAEFDAAGLSKGVYFLTLKAFAEGLSGAVSQPAKLAWLP